MPLTKLEFRPGVNREATSLANEGGWFDCNNIRFRSGYPEKLGGWVSDAGQTTSTLQPPPNPSGYYPPSFWGVCRNLWAWLNLSGYNLLGLGTNLKYYVQNGQGGAFNDITPIRYTSSGFATFVVTAKTASTTTVTVTDVGNGSQPGDFVTFSGITTTSDSAINLTNALDGEFQIQYVNGSTYTIILNLVASTAIGSSITTTGTVIANYQLTTGSDIYTQALGWSAGGWGGGTASPLFTNLTSSLAAVPYTVLNAALSVSATTITVASTSGFASSGSLYIGTEIITYSGVTGTTFTGCARGTGSTTANSYVIRTGVAQYVTGVTINVASTASLTSTGTVVIGNELIGYTGKTSTTLTGATRVIQGSPYAHANSSLVYQYLTTDTGWGSTASQGIGVQLRLWSSANYGQNLIINPAGGAMYYWVVDSNPSIYYRAQILSHNNSNTQDGTAYWQTDTTCPSLVNYVMVSDSSNFVIAFGCNDPSGTVTTTALDPLLVRWSDQQNILTWLPSLTNQAGSYRLSQGSQIVTAIQTRQEILIFTDSAVYNMQYLGPPYVWGFQIMGDNMSIMGPNAVATVNNITYWMGYNKFYVYTGTVSTLPCAVRQYIFDNINLTQSAQVYAGTNEAYNEIWWFYCSVTGTNPDGSQGSGTTSNPNNIMDRYVVYNYLDQTWYYGGMNRSSWLYSPLRQTPIATPYGTTSSGASYGGLLVYHENGVDDGTTNPPSPINAYVQSSDFDIGDGNNFGFIWRCIPDINFTGSTVNQPSVTMTFLPRQFSGSAYGVSNDPTVASTQDYTLKREYIVQQFTPQIYVRARGRQMAFRIESGAYIPTNPKNGVGVAWQSGSNRLDIRPDGRR